jgi:O-antigen biosynthesis protein WbqP
MKRAIDIVGALVLLLIFWPILLILLLWIRVETPGPAIFSQLRVGRGGRQFICYKLRTMDRGTASLPTHQTQASAITPLGNRLRRLKLDELPQLYNVLVGDMSLVGPRPCLPTQVELVEARRRLGVLDVRPGITGLAQVRGIDMSDPERLAQIDAQYAKSVSVRADMRLILATLCGGGMGVDRIVRSQNQG